MWVKVKIVDILAIRRGKMDHRMGRMTVVVLFTIAEGIIRAAMIRRCLGALRCAITIA
jgi:hypothetical protein